MARIIDTDGQDITDEFPAYAVSQVADRGILEAEKYIASEITFLLDSLKSVHEMRERCIRIR